MAVTPARNVTDEFELLVNAIGYGKFAFIVKDPPAKLLKVQPVVLAVVRDVHQTVPELLMVELFCTVSPLLTVSEVPADIFKTTYCMRTK